MAMSLAIRREIGKSRELLWHFLEGEVCFFCKKSLLPYKAKIKFGDATAQPLSDLPTIHHVDGNHNNNRSTNRALAHQSCHKSHHAKLVFAELRGRHLGSAAA